MTNIESSNYLHSFIICERKLRVNKLSPFFSMKTFPPLFWIDAYVSPTSPIPRNLRKEISIDFAYFHILLQALPTKNSFANA